MSLEVTYLTLQEEVARELGWPRDPGVWSDVQDSDFTLFVNSGYRKFLSGEIPGEKLSHNWSFLYPLEDFTLTASYSTGTIVVSGGAVTLTGGTWPSWTEQGELWFADDTSGTTVREDVTDDSLVGDSLTIANTTAEATTVSYTLRRIHYNLPTDFGGMYSDGFTYRRDEQWHLPAIQIVGESDIRRMDRENNGGIYPAYAALIPIAPNRWRVRFYPVASSAYQLEYRYKIAPARLTPANPTIYGGTYYGEAIIAAVLDSAAQRVHSSSEHHDRFLSCMRQAIQHDRRNFSVHTLGQGARTGGHGDPLTDFRRGTSITSATFSFGS